MRSTAVRPRLDGRDVTARVRRDGSRLRVTGGVLGDGRHTVRVTADSALPFGATTTRGWAFVVDTTAPRLGALAASRTVRAGQVNVSGRTEPGATVKASGAGGQRADAVAGRDGRYRFAFRLGEGTNVVRLAVSDAAGNIARATRRIVRDTRAPRLALAGFDEPLDTAIPIAKGQPRYPTPTGSLRVTDKQVDPAWTPPDSPWAAELDTIPAGPGNPLGTRWIGTSRSAIGIHGTFAEGSIGTAASHGCIRMRIADVEQLFRHVRIGTPIRIHV